MKRTTSGICYDGFLAISDIDREFCWKSYTEKKCEVDNLSRTKIEHNTFVLERLADIFFAIVTKNNDRSSFVTSSNSRFFGNQMVVFMDTIAVIFNYLLCIRSAKRIKANGTHWRQSRGGTVSMQYIILSI